MILKINTYDEKIALLSALWSRQDVINKEITEAIIEMATDSDIGGKEYWIDKLTDLGSDLNRIRLITDRVKQLSITAIEPPASDEQL